MKAVKFLVFTIIVAGFFNLFALPCGVSPSTITSVSHSWSCAGGGTGYCSVITETCAGGGATLISMEGCDGVFHDWYFTMRSAGVSVVTGDKATDTAVNAAKNMFFKNIKPGMSIDQQSAIVFAFGDTLPRLLGTTGKVYKEAFRAESSYILTIQD